MSFSTQEQAVTMAKQPVAEMLDRYYEARQSDNPEDLKEFLLTCAQSETMLDATAIAVVEFLHDHPTLFEREKRNPEFTSLYTGILIGRLLQANEEQKTLELEPPAGSNEKYSSAT